MFEIIPILFTIGLILLGGFMFLFGFSALEFFFRIKRKGVRTEGMVNDIDSNIRGVRPWVSFKNEEGKEIDAMPKNVMRGKNTFYRPGDKVIVYYMANDPETFVVDVPAWKLVIGFAAMTFGAGICLTTIFSLIFG